MLRIKDIVYLIIFAGLIFSTSCKEEIAEPVNLHHDYFPSEIGHYIVYEVDSIVYDDFTQTVDTFYYQVKELIESEFTDGDGQKSMRLERYIRFSTEDEWSIKNIWKSRLTEAKATKTEENITYLKLVFPPEENIVWDGNAYNNYNELSYVYTDVHYPYSIDNNSFDSCLVVLQNDFETLISEEYQFEVFAKKIGLVYKKFVDLTKEVDGTITRGVDYSYTYLEHGTE